MGTIVFYIAKRKALHRLSKTVDGGFWLLFTVEK